MKLWTGVIAIGLTLAIGATAAAPFIEASSKVKSRKGGGGAQETEGVESGSARNTTEPACFPSDAVVEHINGYTLQMQDLKVGDEVKVGPGQFSQIFAFTHKVIGVAAHFIRIETECGKVLDATPGHYLYLNGALTPAAKATVGDSVSLGNGETATVQNVRPLEKHGLHNPQTIHGDIVVNGIISSTYTTAIDPKIAHASLVGMRMIYRFFGISTSYLENGAPTLGRI